MLSHDAEQNANTIIELQSWAQSHKLESTISKPATTTLATTPGNLSSGWVNDDLSCRMERARKYVQAVPGAVSGNGGHNLTFKVARVLVKDFALPEMDAMNLFLEWNQTCEPPWTEAELRHKLHDASKLEIPAGSKLQGRAQVSQYGQDAEWTTTREKLETRPIPSFMGKDAADLKGLLLQPVEWIVQEVISKDETLVVAARSKACKTLQLIDLAVSLSCGLPWLKTFEVPKRRRVLFISGEANDRRMAVHVSRALSPRALSFEELRGWLRIETMVFPELNSDFSLQGLQQTVAEFQPDVVIVDPLYRALGGIDSHKLAEMGPRLKALEAACRPAMMVLSHHITKQAARDQKVPELEDLTGAGVAEMAGQWWLVGRQVPYAFDGKHDLAVHYGGRDGQSSDLRVLFDDRQWTFEVSKLSEFVAESRASAKEIKASNKRQQEEQQRDAARVRILARMKQFPTPVSRLRVEQSLELPPKKFGPAFEDLLQEQSVVIRPYIDNLGRIQTTGYILASLAEAYDLKQAEEKQQAEEQERQEVETGQDVGRVEEQADAPAAVRKQKPRQRKAKRKPKR